MGLQSESVGMARLGKSRATDDFFVTRFVLKIGSDGMRFAHRCVQQMTCLLKCVEISLARQETVQI